MYTLSTNNSYNIVYYIRLFIVQHARSWNKNNIIKPRALNTGRPVRGAAWMNREKKRASFSEGTVVIKSAAFLCTRTRQPIKSQSPIIAPSYVHRVYYIVYALVYGVLKTLYVPLLYTAGSRRFLFAVPIRGYMFMYVDHVYIILM